MPCLNSKIIGADAPREKTKKADDSKERTRLKKIIVYDDDQTEVEKPKHSKVDVFFYLLHSCIISSLTGYGFYFIMVYLRINIIFALFWAMFLVGPVYYVLMRGFIK